MILVSLVILAGLALIYLMREPAMVTLFPKLGDEDKAQIMQVLEAQGIKAKLDGAAGQVIVPRADVHRAKMVLAANGLPKAAASGYELLTQMPLGVSRSVEQAKWKSATLKARASIWRCPSAPLSCAIKRRHRHQFS
jgi:flagellar M-ring protein FliF